MQCLNGYEYIYVGDIVNKLKQRKIAKNEKSNDNDTDRKGETEKKDQKLRILCFYRFRLSARQKTEIQNENNGKKRLQQANTEKKE